MKSIFLFSIALAASTFYSSAQSQLVLKAQANYARYSSGYTLQDSVIHMGSPGHNGAVAPFSDHNHVPAPYPLNGIYTEEVTIERDEKGHHQRHYYRNLNTAGLVADVQTVRVTFNGSPHDTEQHIFYSYNAAMLPDTITTWTNYGINWRDAHIYNNGVLVEKLEDRWNASAKTWTPFQRYTYTTSGSDSVYNVTMWDGSAYLDYERNKYIRDGNNRILIDSLFDANLFIKATRYQYNAQGQLTGDSIWKLNSILQTVQYYGKTEYKYDAQGNRTSNTKYSYWNYPPGYHVLVDVDSFTYNNSDQITSFTGYSIDNGVWSPVKWGQYFYYGFPVNVPEVATTDTLQLYPIPATSYINLAMQFTKPQAFSVRIFDMQGRLVNNWQETAQKQYNKQIPVLNMAPGQYTIHILAGNESVSRQFMVVR